MAHMVSNKKFNEGFKAMYVDCHLREMQCGILKPDRFMHFLIEFGVITCKIVGTSKICYPEINLKIKFVVAG